MPKIADFSTGRDNNYNLLRLTAALTIAFYHCYFMVMGDKFTEEQYSALYATSQIVLNFFFIASGFLIAQSFVRKKDLVTYVTARFLRLVPGLFVLSFLVCFVMGPLVTKVSLTDYFLSFDVLAYVPLTTAMDPDRVLPGVFVNNPNANELVTAIWTLRYEVICYIALAVLGLIGSLGQKRNFAVIFAAIILGYAAISYLTSLRDMAGINHMLHFGLSFIVGTAFFVFREHIPLHWSIGCVLILLSVMLHQFVSWNVSEPLMILASAYTVFWLAYIPAGRIRSYNNLGDYSYGVYIYHYPVEQILVQYLEGFTPLSLYIFALPIIFICACLSWVFIEKPSIKSLNSIASWIKQRNSLFKASAAE